jgi:hypothetical protein
MRDTYLLGHKSRFLFKLCVLLAATISNSCISKFCYSEYIIIRRMYCKFNNEEVFWDMTPHHCNVTHHNAANTSASAQDELQLHCVDPFQYGVQEGTYPHHCCHSQTHSWWSLQGTVHNAGMMTVCNIKKLEFENNHN